MLSKKERRVLLGYVDGELDVEDMRGMGLGEEMNRLLVSLKPENIKYMASPCEAAQILAVQFNAELIEYIANPCVGAQRVALRYNYRLVRHIANPDSETIVGFLGVHPRMIGYIVKPKCSWEVYALQLDLDVYKLIKRPCSEAVKYYNMRRSSGYGG